MDFNGWHGVLPTCSFLTLRALGCFYFMLFMSLRMLLYEQVSLISDSYMTYE